MIKYHYICKRDGTCRVIDYHEDHPSDPDNVRTFHAKHSPVLSIALDVGPDERQFDHRPNAGELAAAFGEAAP